MAMAILGYGFERFVIFSTGPRSATLSDDLKGVMAGLVPAIHV
jgi:hypothetical protein